MTNTTTAPAAETPSSRVAADSYQGMRNAAIRADERAAAIPPHGKGRRAALKAARAAWAELAARYD
jgi:hypothetical protein